MCRVFRSATASTSAVRAVRSRPDRARAPAQQTGVQSAHNSPKAQYLQHDGGECSDEIQGTLRAHIEALIAILDNLRRVRVAQFAQRLWPAPANDIMLLGNRTDFPFGAHVMGTLVRCGNRTLW